MEGDYLVGYSEKLHLQEEGRIRNISYSSNGETIAYTTGHVLKVYDAHKLILRNVITAEIDHSVFFQRNTMLQTHGQLVYHHSLYDNKYLRRFDHGQRIESISADPIGDIFMTVSSSSINIWDIRMGNPFRKLSALGYIGVLGTDNQYCIYKGGVLSLFDVREEHGPFSTSTIPSAFYQRIWYALGTGDIVLASKNTYACADSDGNPTGVIALDCDSSGNTTADGDILLCSVKQYIVAYRMNDRSKVGRMSTRLDECTAISANPQYPQFACSSPFSIKIFSQR